MPQPPKKVGPFLHFKDLIITHIFWDFFMSHGDKPGCIEETTYDLCFGNPLYRRLQKLVGNDKFKDGGFLGRSL